VAASSIPESLPIKPKAVWVAAIRWPRAGSANARENQLDQEIINSFESSCSHFTLHRQDCR
jgi:hypothetical protein